MDSLVPILKAREATGIIHGNLFLSPANAESLMKCLDGLWNKIPVKGCDEPDAVALGLLWYIDPQEPDFRLERR